MWTVRELPKRESRARPDVAIAVLTRGQRLDYLKTCLAGILRQTHVADVRVMVWSNGVARETVDWLRTKPVRLFDCPDNVGQHIAVNEMLDEAARMRASYFIRVDD